MKRNKIMFVIAIVAILAVLFVACDDGAQPEHTHTYGAWSITTQPTETATGTATRACACGDVETATIANLSDATVWTVETSQDATHTSKGFKVYKSAYGSVTVTIEKTTEHTYGAWTLTKNPTTTETGTAKRSCVCGAEEEATVAVLTDASVWTTTTSQDPTHESKGFVQYTSVYGTVLVEVPAGQHTYNNWVIKTEPTLTDAGLALSTCVCGHYVEQSIPALTDTTVWTKQHTDATHAAAGSDVYTSVYGTVTIVIPQIAHDFTGEYRDNGDGTHSRKCTGCDAYSTAVEHDFSKKIVDDAHKATDADCTHAATYYYSCECGAVSTELTFESGKAVGHNYSEFKVTKEPTCTETGTADSICSVCGDTQHNTIAALGHKFSETYVPYYATSTSTGEDGDAEVDVDEDSIGHAKKCTVCGYIDKEHYIAHTFGDTYLTAQKATYGTEIVPMHDCSVCGYKHVDENEHNGNLGYLEYSWTVDADNSKVPTYNEAGYTSYKFDKWTYKLEIPKLVAPYDGKTYHVMELYLDRDKQIGKASAYYWNSAVVTIDAITGKGTGTSSPLTGENSIKMVDATTGQIEYTVGSTKYVGYVDMTNGIIVLSADTNTVYVLSPLEETLKTDSFAGSYLNGVMVGSYSYDCAVGSHTFNFYVVKDGNDACTFDVKFVDANGAEIAADACYSADYVKITKDGEKLVAYQKNANGILKETDGKEGTYVDANYGTVALNGIGGASINGNAGVYSYNADKAVYELYVGTSQADATAYYTFTFTDEGIQVEKPMVVISYLTDYGYETIGDEYKTVNANVKFTLPVLANIAEAGANEFVGWTIAGQDGYVTEYTPNGTDGTVVTFTAVWKIVYVISIIDGAEGVESVKVPENETIYNYLPVWGEVGNLDFVGWFVDDGDGKYTEGTDLELAEDKKATENITIIAVWSIIPAYVGTYYGGELWNAGYGNSGGSTLTIDKEGNISGNISGYKTGKVSSYDPNTQKITWTSGTFYFDADAKVILGLDDNNNIGNDYYFFGQDLESTKGKVTKNYGIYMSADKSWTAQFIQAKTALGDDTIIFTYNNVIYSGVELKDTLGNALTVGTIANAASVVVYKDGKVIFARGAAEGKATIGAGNGSSSIPRELDSYFGKYTCDGKDDLVFDGVGGFTWGTKSGTYTVIDADAKTFGLYVVANSTNTEYYTVTLDGSTYTSEKPMVTISFVVPDGFAPIDDMADINANIGVKLPDADVEGYIFNGYYKDSAFTQKVDATNFVTSVSVTLYAKYSTPVTITYHYNDGTTANKEVVYSEGDTQTVADPSRAKYAFGGWYLDDTTFANAWDGIADSTKDVYAKWVECVYAQKYTFVYVSSLSAKSGTQYANKPYYSTSVTFDGTTGKGTFDRTDKKESLPFFECSSANSYEKSVGWYDTETVYLGYAIEVSDYDVTTGKMTFSVVKYAENSSNDTTYTYYGIVDKATGIIVVSYTSGVETITKFGFFMPEGYSVSVSSVTTWNSKNTVLDYNKTVDGTTTTQTLLIDNGNVYLDAKVVDIDGNHIACNDVAKAESVFIYASQDATEPLYSLGYDGTQLVDLDGNQGTYTSNDGSITLNGRDKITIKTSVSTVTGTYTASGVDDYDFDVVAGNKSYKLSIDKDNKTYALVDNTVIITYVSDGETITPQAVYVGIASELYTPAERDDLVFQGWYVQDDATQTLVSMTEFVTNTAVTLVAKWVTKVTLTIVYENGMENATYALAAGATLDMSQYEPEYTNGKAFSKWTISGADGVRVDFTATTITENITVYCEWVESDPYTIKTSSSYKFTYAQEDGSGVWTSGNYNRNNSESWFEITALADLTITFQYFCESENATRFDYLTISKNGSTLYTDGGDKKSTITYSETVTVTLKADETLKFKYEKDGSTRKNLDCAKIKDLTINGTAVTEM